MTGERLHDKSDIAAELAYRDSLILTQQERKVLVGLILENIKSFDARAEKLEVDKIALIDKLTWDRR